MKKMGLFDAFKKKNAAPLPALMKRGKTEEQCKCIDFFFSKDDEKGGKKKKKGCFGSGEMTMDEYCALVQKKVDSLGLKERAIAKIGLDESQISEIPPVALASFLFRGDCTIFTKSEETNIGGVYKHVSNIYQITWIFFSSTQLYTYTYQFDMISDNVVETTKDFFYTDITCIKTTHEVEEFIIEKKSGCLGKVKYQHQNKHWDSLRVTVPGEDYAFFTRTTDTIEQSIQPAKAMIRERKGA